jgi:uncharacterized protein (DUF1501 family)
MQNQHFNILTRRAFFDRSVKAGMAVALSTLVDIPFVMKRALAEGSIGLNGKKVLFIWLRGANDGLNSLAPIGDSAYAASRPTLRLPMDPGTNYAATGACDAPEAGSASSVYGDYPYAIRTGNGFAALHPSLKFLAPVYNSGDLALIHRVAYPRQSRSHFDSQNYWETGSPNNNLSKDGIFYRTIIESGLAHTAPLTAVSVQSSLPLILRGSAAAMTNLTDPNRYDLLGIPNTAAGNAKAAGYLTQAGSAAFPSKMSRDLLQLQYANMNNTLSIFAGIDFTEAGNTFRDDVKTDGDIDWYPENQAGGNDTRGYYLFPTTSVKNGGWRRPTGNDVFNKYVVPTSLHGFFGNLKAAALVLNKTDAIIAGTEFGGFDTHNGQGTIDGNHPNLNRGIGWALYALRKYFTLYADKATWENVVVVTLSEFGRTTVENSDLGTDHAEAGVMFLAGGAVRGYEAGTRSGIFNCNPNDPAPTVPWTSGTGGSMFGVSGRYLRRNTDYRSVLGEIIRKHLGATQGQLNRIIPGYASAGEALLSGGTSSVDGTPIRGEVGFL